MESSSSETQLYFSEVGQYDVLSSVEERKLLLQYHTCPHCRVPWPRVVQKTRCTQCNEPIPNTVTGSVHTCTSCSAKFNLVKETKTCPKCGSARDTAPRQRLITANLRFVIKTAKKFTSNPDHLLKLISAGNVGLLLAVDRFDITKKTRFLTYAAWWIRKEMLDEMNASNNIVHVPIYLQKKIRRVAKEGAYKCIHCGTRTTDPQYSNQSLTECPKAPAHDFYLSSTGTSKVLRRALSLDTVEPEDDFDLFRSVAESRTGKKLRQVLDSLELGPRDKFILLGFFNVPASDRKSAPKRLPQLSAITGITPERVRQIKVRVLNRLKVALEASPQ